MKYALLVFLATWLSVFTLGLQSLNVNQGHYAAAAFTSLGIGIGHVFLYKFMPSADWLQLAAYFAGGVSGITSSMWFHRRAKAWLSFQLARWRARRIVSRRPDEHRDVSMAGGVLVAAARCSRCGCGPEVPVCKYDALCPRLQTDVH